MLLQRNIYIQNYLYSRLIDFSFPFSCLQVLRNAVSKTYNRISDLRKEISSLKKAIISAEEAATKAKVELEAAESKLSLVDGEPVLGENPAKLTRFKSNAEKTKEEEVSVRESLEAKDALLTRALDENKVFEMQLVLTFPCPPPLPTQLICYNASLIGGCWGGGRNKKM